MKLFGIDVDSHGGSKIIEKEILPQMHMGLLKKVLYC